MNTAPASSVPRPTTPARAQAVMTEELAAFVQLLEELDDQDWQRPTDCTGWSVRDVVAHVTGAMDEGARMRVQLRHLLTATRRYPDLDRLDAMNQLQVDDRRGATPAELLTELQALGPRAARARRRMPKVVRNRRVPGGMPLPEGATLGYLADVIYPRDLWMHRVDVERATGREHRGTFAEGYVVAEVVRDLAETWTGPSVDLTLTGAGRGTWQLGPGAPEGSVTCDAVALCRSLSGRDGEPEVTSVGEHDAAKHLLAARIPF